MENLGIKHEVSKRGGGHIFKPKYKTKSGVRESRFFYIQYYRDGARYVENTHSDKITAAKGLLRKRLGSEAFIAPKAEKITFDELAADVITNYEQNERNSLHRLHRSIAYLTKFFRGQRAININGATASEYAVLRRKQPGEEGSREGISTGAAIATVNRELAALRRMFNLGKKNGKVRFVLPTISLTKENNTRKGFLEHEQYRQLRAVLPEYARSVLVAMYYTGMRIGEVLAIQWNQVDIDEREIRLEPGTTKNDEARTLPLHGELLEVVRMQREVHDRKFPTSPWLFSHGGKRIKNFYKAWRTSCVKVGLGRNVCSSCSGEIDQSGACPQCSAKAAKSKYVGLIPHDLRRTGVRNLIRAGVSRSVAMRISGHKTESVFNRYDITSQGDLREAAQKLTKYIEEKNSQRTTKVSLPDNSSETIQPVSLLN
ncbi:MAG TPA: tyrosine-type recombinase/integrase [Candidatus Acidoferrales bacterium]|nr:tyrosine-type recombinase/integrase [Candidatus Acidoferrales bacterium]